MRRIITIFLTLCAVVCYASDIECVGTATQIVKGNDTVYVFKDEIHLRSKIGAINWYNADGSPYATNTDEIYPDEGCYKAAGSSFCVALYSDMPDLTFTVDTHCDNTLLRVSGIPASVYARTYSLSYNALAWNTEAWVDSLAEKEGDLKNLIDLKEPLYGATTITLCYDAAIRTALGLDSACVEVEVPIDSIIAVKHEMTSLTTTRDATNEKNRPSSQDIIRATVGEDISAPLEVAFYSNATPAARFFQWDIYHSTEHIVRRFDPDIRYLFSEPGAYRVVCKVSNGTCASDSTEMMVAISESYLAVPNVFTPNGDGQNDEFRVAYRSLAEFHIWVYNRWGKLVYESTDPAKGWDGMIGSRQASEGAYFYVIRAKGTDAEKDAGYMSKISYNKKKLNADESVIGIYQLSGDINLLRGNKK